MSTAQDAQAAVDKMLANDDEHEQRISFVAASGRGYTIWLEDWESICKTLHEAGIIHDKRNNLPPNCKSL